jgi:hypothetical protein
MTIAVDQSVQTLAHPVGQFELTSLSVSPEAVMSIKLLLVDDSDVMRSAIRQLLKKELGIEVIGAATSFAEALALTAALCCSRTCTCRMSANSYPSRSNLKFFYTLNASLLCRYGTTMKQRLWLKASAHTCSLTK